MDQSRNYHNFPSPLSSRMFLSQLHVKFTACYLKWCQDQVAQQKALLQQRQHIIILSAYKHSRNSFVSGPGAVILTQMSRVKLILTQVIVSLQALTSSFGYNYLPRSGILSTFVTETPALPDEINLSYFLCWIFFLPVTDLILTAQQSMTAEGLPFTCRAGEFFAEWTTSRLIYVSGPCICR